MEKNIKRSSGIFLGLIVFIGLFFRLNTFLQNPSFWFDETALAYNIVSLKYFDLFGVLNLQQVAPPLFLILTKWIVSVFGTSEMCFRFIPFFLGCVAFIPFYYLLKEIFKDNSAPINFGMFLFAINPKLIYYGIEFKPYLTDAVFAIVIFLAFLKIDLKSWDWKKLLLTGFGLSFLCWFSFTSIILVMVGMITILLAKKEYKNWIIMLSPIIFNYLIFGVYYLKVSSFYRDFMTSFFANEFNHFTIPIAYFFNNEIPFAILVTSIALVVGIMYFMIENKRFEISFIMWSFIVTICLSQLHLYPAYQRFMLFLLPYFIIVLAMVFNFLSQRKNFQSRLVLVIIVLALIPTSINYKNSQARELTKYFLENLNKQDIVVINNLALPDFLFYTFDTKMENKIIVPFDKKNGKILYKLKAETGFPDGYNAFWYYATKTNGFDKVLEKDGNLEKVKDFVVINKMIERDGAVLKLAKPEN